MSDKIKVSLFLSPEAARQLRVIAAEEGCRGVSELIEDWTWRERIRQSALLPADGPAGGGETP